MRIISAGTQAVLATGRFGTRTLIKLSPYGSDPLCYWDDIGSIVYDSDTYLGAAGRFDATLPDSSSDLSISGAQVRFSGLDTAIVNIIEGAVWSQRPAKIMQAVFALETPQILVVHNLFSGFMDRMEWTEATPGIDGGQGKPSSLVLYLESTAREFSLAGARTASDADQRERDASDGFFSFAASAGSQAIDWGRGPDSAASQKPELHGFARLMDKIF